MLSFRAPLKYSTDTPPSFRLPLNLTFLPVLSLRYCHYVSDIIDESRVFKRRQQSRTSDLELR